MLKILLINVLLLLVLIRYAHSKESVEISRLAVFETTTTPAVRNVADTNNAVDILAIMNECNETFRIEMSYIEALNGSGSFPDETVKTPKCYVRCVLETAGVATSEGQYDSERAAVAFGGERAGKQMDDIQDLTKTCADRNADRQAAGTPDEETCKCERAYQFMKCLMELEIEKYDKRQ